MFENLALTELSTNLRPGEELCFVCCCEHVESTFGFDDVRGVVFKQRFVQQTMIIFTAGFSFLCIMQKSKK